MTIHQTVVLKRGEAFGHNDPECLHFLIQLRVGLTSRDIALQITFKILRTLSLDLTWNCFS